MRYDYLKDSQRCSSFCRCLCFDAVCLYFRIIDIVWSSSASDWKWRWFFIYQSVWASSRHWPGHRHTRLWTTGMCHAGSSSTSLSEPVHATDPAIATLASEPPVCVPLVLHLPVCLSQFTPLTQPSPHSPLNHRYVSRWFFIYQSVWASLRHWPGHHHTRLWTTGMCHAGSSSTSLSEPVHATDPAIATLASEPPVCVPSEFWIVERWW